MCSFSGKTNNQLENQNKECLFGKLLIRKRENQLIYTFVKDHRDGPRMSGDVCVNTFCHMIVVAFVCMLYLYACCICIFGVFVCLLYLYVC